MTGQGAVSKTITPETENRIDPKMTELQQTIALLHPGEMGAAIGACLVASGYRVVWDSTGRSPATRARADAAGLKDLASLDRVLKAASVVLSVCPPHGALELARTVAEKGYTGIYVDANAVSPDTAREAARTLEASGASFVDGGIIGSPPGKASRTRLYLSGRRAESVAALFAGGNLEAIPLDGPVGTASALKVCYAAWTKGATALLAAIRALARQHGVETALLQEWSQSQPELPRRSEAIGTSARKAWRWIAEMEEIASSLGAAGLPEGFHLAAAEIYRRLESFKDCTAPPQLPEVIDALRRGAKH